MEFAGDRPWRSVQLHVSIGRDFSLSLHDSSEHGGNGQCGVSHHADTRDVTKRHGRGGVYASARRLRWDGTLRLYSHERHVAARPHAISGWRTLRDADHGRLLHNHATGDRRNRVFRCTFGHDVYQYRCSSLASRLRPLVRSGTRGGRIPWAAAAVSGGIVGSGPSPGAPGIRHPRGRERTCRARGRRRRTLRRVTLSPRMFARQIPLAGRQCAPGVFALSLFPCRFRMSGWRSRTMIQRCRYSQMTVVTILLVLIGSVARAADHGNGMMGMGPIQRSIRAQDWTTDLPRGLAVEQRPPLHQIGPNQASRKLIWGLIAVVAGAVVGYQVGNVVDHNDPDHLGGVVFGIPIGAVAGGVIGVWAASK
jgi:hypothetical protein